MSGDNTETNLILATASPRRAQLLSRLGLSFQVRPVEAVEVTKSDPKETVIINARRKAEKALMLDNSLLVLTADTVIDLDGKIIGKPSSKEEAFKLLKTFSGRTHRCTTAVCLAKFDFFEVRTDQTLVTFKNIRDCDILSYLESVDPTDKAGGYGIQEMGWSLVKSIEGTFDNVMGLPLGKVLEILSLAKVRGLL
jgi:septum formation protein